MWHEGLTMNAITLILAMAATLPSESQLYHLDQGAPSAQTTPAAPAQPVPPAKEDDAFAKAVKDYDKKSGVVDAYVKGESVLFGVPKNKFGRDFIWYIELKRTPAGSYSGTEVGSGVVRFEMRGDKILLRQISYDVQSSDPGSIKIGLEQSNVMPIISVFDARATSPDGTVLIDVTRLFRNGLPEIPLAGSLGGAAFDPSRTFIDRVLAFPDNINVEVTATAAGGGGGGRSVFGGPAARPSNTGVIHHSFAILPEKPMMGRIKDSRVGYFSYGFTDFGAQANQAKPYELIARYRLEKKDPSAALSEPVEPIIYYLAPEIPERWRKFMKKGVEDWNVAFEAAGFKNAIRCEDAPNDPNWSPEDVRYSVIRWAPLPIANAMGPHIADPRSGEILSAHVIMWHDVLQLCEDWYFAQASPNDPKAQRIPLPYETVGECLRFVVAHEVGHTLGLPHNGKSSAMVPTALLRNAKWTQENGTAGSIMDYARFNYVAQPGDNANLFPKVGVYDKFSIKWGYMPINGVSNPEDEKPVLDALASQQVTNPLLRFYDNFNGADPTAQSESLGDDAVIASTYGVANLRRVMSYLLPATTKLGEDYSDLGRLYGAVWGQYGDYMGHVLTMVGGVVETDFRGGRGGNVYNHLAASRQKAAVQWLADNVLATPTYLVPSNVLARLGPTSGASRVLGSQRRVINGLLQEQRVARMTDNELMNGRANAYTVQQMMLDLRASVWSELTGSQVGVGIYRRSMQRFWVNTLVSKMASPNSELRAYSFAELKATQRALNAAAPKASDVVTRQHLEDLAQIIDLALKFPPAAAPAAPQQTLQQLLGLPISESQQDDCTICRRRE